MLGIANNVGDFFMLGIVIRLNDWDPVLADQNLGNAKLVVQRADSLSWASPSIKALRREILSKSIAERKTASVEYPQLEGQRSMGR